MTGNGEARVRLTKALVLVEHFGDDETPWRVVIAKPDRSVWGRYSTRELAQDAARAAHSYYAATECGVEDLRGFAPLTPAARRPGEQP